jgi:5'(3')-deoxyribonucleotidase
MKAEFNFDCDGVLADFHKHVCDWVDREIEERNRRSSISSVDPMSMKVDRGREAYSFKELFTPYQFRIAESFLNDSEEFWRTLPVMEGAQIAFELIAGWGHDFTIVTAPWTGFEKWTAFRYRWLKKHFDIDSADVITGKKKRKVSGDIFIEDNPPNVVDWLDRNPDGRAVLIAAPYNKKHDRRINRRTWKNPNWFLDLADEVVAQKKTRRRS